MPPSVEYQQPPQENQEMTDRGMKRSLAPGTLPKQPKKPRLIKLDPRSSPLQYLNTIRPGLDFKVDRTGGPAHEPKFSVTVVVDGTTYSGRGKSKQHAKQYAAVEALKVLLSDSSLQYQEDAARGPGGVFISEPATSEKTEPAAQKASDASSSPTAPNATNITPASVVGKTPVQILNEMDTTALYKCVAEDPINLHRRFTMTVTVKGATYRAFGANKKQAKHAAARSALIAMGTPIADAEALADDTLADLAQGGQRTQQNLADRVGTKILDKYEDVMRNRPDKKPWKVLAGTGGRFQNGGNHAAGQPVYHKGQYQQGAYYKNMPYYQQQSPQRQGIQHQQQQQQQQQHQIQPQQFRPVVKRLTGPYANNFVPASTNSNGQSRTNWMNGGSSNSGDRSASNGHSSKFNNSNNNNNITLQDRTTGGGGGQTRYPAGAQDSQNAGYYAYDRYRSRGNAVQTVATGHIATASPRSVAAGASGGGKAVAYPSSTSSSSQHQWAQGWTEASGDTTNWQYHNAYYGNGEAAVSAAAAAAAHEISAGSYTASWNYGYGQEANTYHNNYGSMGSSAVVMASTAPQGYSQGDGRSLNEYNAWGARY